MTLRYVVYARETGFDGSWVDSRWANRWDAVDRVEALEQWPWSHLSAWIEDEGTD